MPDSRIHSSHERSEDANATPQQASLHAGNLIEASLNSLVTISPEGKITGVNKATEKVTGMPREYLIGNDFSDYFMEPGRAQAGYQKGIQQGMVRDYPLTIRHVSGGTTDVLYNATVYRNEAGAVEGVFAAARDITERKRMEEALRANGYITKPVDFAGFFQVIQSIEKFWLAVVTLPVRTTAARNHL
jgi:PAS domain S-box-containing protein